MGCPKGCRAAALRPEPRLPHPPDGRLARSSRAPAAPAASPAAPCSGPTSSTTTTGRPARPSTFRPAGWRPRAARTSTRAAPAARNGADIFRVAVGLTETHTWWRIDWNTLLDPSVPIALFTFDTDRGQATTAEWPAGAGVRSAGIDLALLVSAAGARLIDLTTRRVDSGRAHRRHGVAVLPRPGPAHIGGARPAPGRSGWPPGWRTTTATGSPTFPSSAARCPGSRTCTTSPSAPTNRNSAHLNFWSDQAQAAALTDGDVTEFSLAVPWDQLADRITTDEPVVKGTSIRWYVSSIELGQGVAETDILSTEPQFLGRVQPYSVCLPATYAPGRKLPLTLLLHSLALGQNQFAAIDPRLLHQICDGRDSVVVTPLARGPSCWYFDEGELDVWEVWARVAEQLGTDPNRTVISGYSMGGYGGLQVGADLSGGVRPGGRAGRPADLRGAAAARCRHPGDLDPDSHCAREGDTWPAARQRAWLPFVIAHGVLDEIVPLPSVLQQVLELDRLGYRYRFTVYPFEDHIAWVFKDEFDDPVSHMGTGLRQATLGTSPSLGTQS